MSTLRRALSRPLALAALLGVGACASHDAEPAFRASVLIGDRGISIPLPPPSLRDEPEQEVEVSGSAVGLTDTAGDLTVQVYDQVSGESVSAALTEGEAFVATGLTIDLTDNCLELWLEDLDGNEGEHLLYSAQIESQPDGSDAVVVVEGCD